MNQSIKKSVLSGIGLAAIILGYSCDKQSSPTAATPNITRSSLPENLFVSKEPPGAKPLEEVKKNAKTGDLVALTGRIGGSKEPFVDGRAIFTVVGPGLNACGRGSPMPDCKTPWDYCCDPAKEIAAHSATIQVVDSAGAPLKFSFKGQHNLKELDNLVVVGKVHEATGRLLIINATALYIRQE